MKYQTFESDCRSLIMIQKGTSWVIASLIQAYKASLKRKQSETGAYGQPTTKRVVG